jgi:hypothetical protein
MKLMYRRCMQRLYADGELLKLMYRRRMQRLYADGELMKLMYRRCMQRLYADGELLELMHRRCMQRLYADGELLKLMYRRCMQRLYADGELLKLMYRRCMQRLYGKITNANIKKLPSQSPSYSWLSPWCNNAIWAHLLSSILSIAVCTNQYRLSERHPLIYIFQRLVLNHLVN